MGLSRKLASFIWWSHPRGSLEYDIMVAVILAFIFLSPRSWFHHPPHPSAALTAPAVPQARP